MNPVTILVATTNEGKLREARAILGCLPMRMTTLAEYPPFPKPIEDASTFEGNARLKALHYAKLAGCLTLADDSGLEVDALGGEPGVRSARYAGPGCDDAANNQKLVRQLEGVPAERRTARFRCLVALASPDEIVATTSGVVEGVILDSPRGSNGFGYDPHFFVPERGMTTAQMSAEDKNRISHRGRAFRAIRTVIERLLAESAGATLSE